MKTFVRKIAVRPSRAISEGKYTFTFFDVLYLQNSHWHYTGSKIYNNCYDAFIKKN